MYFFKTLNQFKGEKEISMSKLIGNLNFYKAIYTKQSLKILKQKRIKLWTSRRSKFVKWRFEILEQVLRRKTKYVVNFIDRDFSLTFWNYTGNLDFRSGNHFYVDSVVGKRFEHSRSNTYV